MNDSYVCLRCAWHRECDHIHGMSDQDAFVEFLPFDKLLHVLRHSTVIVLRSMERMAMVTQILFRYV